MVHSEQDTGRQMTEAEVREQLEDSFAALCRAIASNTAHYSVTVAELGTLTMSWEPEDQ